MIAIARLGAVTRDLEPGAPSPRPAPAGDGGHVSTTASPRSWAGCSTTPSRCSRTSSTPSSGSAASGASTTTDLALLTDGLRAEREQGITIDVAYRYFSTATRSYVLADTPGHVQYTRNMVTGASTAELALILIDARHGVVEQTRRHLAVTGLLGVRHVARRGQQDGPRRLGPADVRRHRGRVRLATQRGFGIEDVQAVPVSALFGDNVVDRSDRASWYAGPTLLEHLESVPVGTDPADAAAADAGAVRHPPAERRAPRLPRVCRSAGLRRRPPRRRGRRPARPAARTTRGGHRPLGPPGERVASRSSTSPSPRSRWCCDWPTTSTSPAATSSRRPTSPACTTRRTSSGTRGGPVRAPAARSETVSCVRVGTRTVRGLVDDLVDQLDIATMEQRAGPGRLAAQRDRAGPRPAGRAGTARRLRCPATHRCLPAHRRGRRHHPGGGHGRAAPLPSAMAGEGV